MSSTLTIEPVNRPTKSLSYELKLILRKKFGGTVLNQKMDSSDLFYLYGLRDCGVPDAEIIIDYITKHDQVILNEEF